MSLAGRLVENPRREVNRLRGESTMATTYRVGSGQRRQMIAEAAYFRAERRGFNGGDPVADWIDAEAEVDAELGRLERERTIERLELAVASASRVLDSFKKKVSKLTADARAEWHDDAEKLKGLRDEVRKKLGELRAQGEQVGHKAREQAEKLRDELDELIERVGNKIHA
jgi:F0F1-type ATP synthase membrane subunit b/b'